MRMIDKTDAGIYYVWLSRINGIGTKNANVILEIFGDAESVWNASFNELTSKGVNTRIANIVSRNKNLDKAKALVEESSKKGIDCICIKDECYPVSLRNIYDPPIIIYIKGSLPDKNEMYFAVIGTRDNSEYGGSMAFSISKDLAKRNVVIVSGMARGIDSIAHRGAISGGGKTVAVFGSGLDVCYPPENEKLMEQIIQNGCIVSEYPLGTQPFPGNFPKRNRIISGLSRGILVVEAGERSGTQITVDLALDDGKEVFAIPGNATNTKSLGTNKLIKNGAILVTSAEHIFEEMNYAVSYELQNDSGLEYEKNVMNELDDDERLVYANVTKEPVLIEQIAVNTGFTHQTTAYILTCLEINGHVTRMPGNRYMKKL